MLQTIITYPFLFTIITSLSVTSLFSYHISLFSEFLIDVYVLMREFCECVFFGELLHWAFLKKQFGPISGRVQTFPGVLLPLTQVKTSILENQSPK